MIWNEWKFMTKPEKVLHISGLLTLLCALVVMILYLALDLPYGSEIFRLIVSVGFIISGIDNWVYHYERKWAIADFICAFVWIAMAVYIFVR